MPVFHHGASTMETVRAWCPRCRRETEQTVERFVFTATSTYWCNRCLIPREATAQAEAGF